MFETKILNDMEKEGWNSRHNQISLLSMLSLIEVVSNINVNLLEIEMVTDKNKAAIEVHEKINARLSEITNALVQDMVTNGSIQESDLLNLGD